MGTVEQSYISVVQTTIIGLQQSLNASEKQLPLMGCPTESAQIEAVKMFKLLTICWHSEAQEEAHLLPEEAFITVV